MGNTVFYNNINEDSSKIGWKDIFSDYKKKHSKEDFDYALAAGTALNTASEEYMLQKWRKPWLFYPLLKWGIGLIVLLYVIYFGLQITGVGIVVPAIGQLTIIIPPLVGPVILMILFWEMNIPRNISIYELFAIWVIGGLISIVVANILFIVLPETGYSCFDAPLAEEPAKLIAALLIMHFISKKKKIYGITGFVIGAAVGTGFGAFESVQYAFSNAQTVSIQYTEMGQAIAVVDTQMSIDVLYVQILRLLLSIGGHTMYCAPYSAEIARNAKNGKVSFESVFNIDFFSAFFVSCLLHGLWDLDIIRIPGGLVGRYIYLIILIIIIWIQGIRILRKSLNQVVQIGASASKGAALQHGAGEGATSFVGAQSIEKKVASPSVNTPINQSVNTSQKQIAQIRIAANSGELKGQHWQFGKNEVIIVGRDANSNLRYSSSAKGVSGRHCSIQMTQFGWTIKDLGSTYGTFLSGNKRVLPGTEVKLQNGDIVSLGGNENTLVVELL